MPGGDLRRFALGGAFRAEVFDDPFEARHLLRRHAAHQLVLGVDLAPQPGIQSYQTYRFGSTQMPSEPLSPQVSHTVSQFLQPRSLRQGTQKSSHLQPQQMISTFFSSSTRRQIFWQEQQQPQWAAAAVVGTGDAPRRSRSNRLATAQFVRTAGSSSCPRFALSIEVEPHADDVGLRLAEHRCRSW